MILSSCQLDDIFALVAQVKVYPHHVDGVASVKFKAPDAAAKCVSLMSGRFFGGRQVAADLWDGIAKYGLLAAHTMHLPVLMSKQAVIDACSKWCLPICLTLLVSDQQPDLADICCVGMAASPRRQRRSRLQGWRPSQLACNKTQKMQPDPASSALPTYDPQLPNA